MGLWVPRCVRIKWEQVENHASAASRQWPLPFATPGSSLSEDQKNTPSAVSADGLVDGHIISHPSETIFKQAWQVHLPDPDAGPGSFLVGF
jgi:hypothetical protein